MSMIDLFNKNVSDAINKYDILYENLFGKSDFIPELVIVNSDDINCGAVCNELEYARLVTDYYAKSLHIDYAEHNELEFLISSFINLPRRGTIESDTVLRNRFKFIAVNNTVKRRTTRYAIAQAIKYFIVDESSIQVIEQFDSKNLYFQVRVEGVLDTSAALTLNSTEFGYLDQFFLSGSSVGAVNTYIASLISRIKASGIDFDILFINQNNVNKSVSAFIGVIQLNKTVNARIKAKVLFTKVCNATII